VPTATASPQRRSVADGRELIALLAMATALTALGIDLMLPGFDEIRADLGLGAGSTAVTGLVTAYFVGLGLGTVFYGPLADHKGRRWTMRLGLAIYVAGALLAAVAPSLPLILVARFLWGIGAAGPRVVALAVVRDRFEGDAMSRTMSSLMAVFLLVPILAPAAGAGLLLVASWRWLFVLCAAGALLVALWTRRLPETLADAHRIPDLRFHRVRTAARLVVSSRATVAYAAATVALYAVFASYLGSAEAIVDQVLDRAPQFPLIFGVLAASMGAAALLNGRIVATVGTRGMVRAALSTYVVMTVVLLGVAVATDGRPGVWLFVGVMAVLLASHAQLLPNLNTLAMDPMAAIAGTASSVLGAAQLTLGAVLGGVLDRFFDGTILPLAIGFVLAAVATVVAVRAAGSPPVAVEAQPAL
jgi:MFS transporter, DHA1 family, multidrug resistance protein